MEVRHHSLLPDLLEGHVVQPARDRLHTDARYDDDTQDGMVRLDVLRSLSQPYTHA